LDVGQKNDERRRSDILNPAEPNDRASCLVGARHHGMRDDRSSALQKKDAAHRHASGVAHRMAYPTARPHYYFLGLTRAQISGISMKKEPNQALEPTTTAVTDRAGARSAPVAVVAHL
jgi:hypothetical protein